MFCKIDLNVLRHETWVKFNHLLRKRALQVSRRDLIVNRLLPDSLRADDNY